MPTIQLIRRLQTLLVANNGRSHGNREALELLLSELRREFPPELFLLPEKLAQKADLPKELAEKPEIKKTAGLCHAGNGRNFGPSLHNRPPPDLARPAEKIKCVEKNNYFSNRN